MVGLMVTKAINPRLTQKEIVKELGYSTSALEQYKHDIDMLSPYTIPPDRYKRRKKIPNDDTHSEPDLKRPQLTSDDFKGPQVTSKEPTNEYVKTLKSKNENSLNGGSLL